MAEKELQDLTGLSNVDPKERPMEEADLIKALLEMAEENTSTEEAVTIDIKRGGKVRFSFRVHPVSDEDIRIARKAATTYMANPNNKKLPKIEKDRDEVQYRSLIIYNATIPEDRAKIWDNQKIKERFDLVQGHDTIDKILNVGEKMKIFEKILEVSGMNEDDDDDEVSVEDYTKN